MNCVSLVEYLQVNLPNLVTPNFCRIRYVVKLMSQYEHIKFDWCDLIKDEKFIKFFHRCLIKCIEMIKILIYAAPLILRQRANLEGEMFVFEVQVLVITHTLLSDNFFWGEISSLNNSVINTVML